MFIKILINKKEKNILNNRLNSFINIIGKNIELLYILKKYMKIKNKYINILKNITIQYKLNNSNYNSIIDALEK